MANSGAMTEHELEILRLKASLEVHLTLLRGLYTALANTSPAAAKGFRGQFEALRKAHQKIAIQGVAPEYSELLAGEYQDALDDALKQIEAGFKV